MTFHTQVVGANGQRQAMFIERMPGLAEVILVNFTFGPNDVMIVFSASGLTAVPVEMARGARRAACASIAVTSVAQSMSAEPDPAAGARLLDEADLVIDLCTPHADALVDIDGLDTPVGPGSTIAAVAIVNSHQGADRRAPRGARGDAAGHHPGLGRRRRALAGLVRRGLSRARAAHRPCHHKGGVMTAGATRGGDDDRSRISRFTSSVDSTARPDRRVGTSRRRTNDPEVDPQAAARPGRRSRCSRSRARPRARRRRRALRRPRPSRIGTGRVRVRIGLGGGAVHDRLLERWRRRQRLPRGAGLHRQGRGARLGPGRPSSSRSTATPTLPASSRTSAT